MRILFLTDNFPPESNAPATRTYEHCVEWVAQGAEVTVITCAPNYPQGKLFPGYKNKWRQEEMMDGIRVIRVWSYISPNRGLFRRILDYLSFCFTAFFTSFSVKTDVIIATSPQLFTALSGFMVSVVKRRPWIMEVRDLWPESIKAVDAMNDTFLLKLIDQLVLFLYRNASRVVVVTDAFKLRMMACGVPENKVFVIKNGVYLHKFLPTKKDQGLLQSLGLTDKFIVAYIGTHGMAHNLSFILDCAAKIKDPRIHFLFLGEGAMKSRLKEKLERLQLTNVSMLDAVLKAEVAQYIGLADVALINLKKTNTFKKVLPSKIFENAAMQKPILLGVEGEAAELIKVYSAGLCFDPENEKDFLRQLNRLYTDSELYQSARKGAAKLALDFDRQTLALEMYLVIKAVALPAIKSVNPPFSSDGKMERN